MRRIALLDSWTQVGPDSCFSKCCIYLCVVKVVLVVVKIIEVLNTCVMVRKNRVNLSRLFLGQSQKNNRPHIDYRLHYQNGKHNHEYGAEREAELALVASYIFKRLLDEEPELLTAR